MATWINLHARRFRQQITAKNRSRQRRRLSVEPLEGRQLLSALALSPKAGNPPMAEVLDKVANHRAVDVRAANAGSGVASVNKHGKRIEAVAVYQKHPSPARAIVAVRPSAVTSDFPFQDPILPEYAEMDRLAYYNPATKLFEPFTAPHTITNSATTPHNVYVIAHGWAPGYLPWVEKIQKQKGNPLPLSWNTWQGKGEKPDDGPVTPWLFESSKTGFGPTFTISDKGLAQQILAVDPNATVIAYSWIDDSATTTGVFGIPKTPEHSEGYTTMNGMRMAQAIMDVLGPNYYQGVGKVHLLGHSHGARVATEAALALQQAGKINPQFNVVGQLTLFDSPENNDASTNDRNPIWIDAANYDWFLLAQLNIARAVTLSGTITSGQTSVMLTNQSALLSNQSNLVTGMGVTGNGISSGPGTTIVVNPITRQVTLSRPAQQSATNVQLSFSPPANSIFVDSYNSYFGSDLGNFVVNDPAQGISNVHLNNMIDVQLVALNRAYPAGAFSAMHQYAANWYAGSVVTQAGSSRPPVGIRWSPLLRPGPQNVAASQWKQGWSYYGATAENQFKLEPDLHGPVTPEFFDTPLTFRALRGNVVKNSSNAVTAVTLTSGPGKTEFYGDVRRRNAVVGFSFDCNFAQIGDGSQLQILLNGSVYFAMSGGVADSSSLPGNAHFETTFGFAGVGNDPQIEMRLVRPASVSGTPTVVTVSNFHEFTD